ncbi:hypothetical protein BHE74_00013270 [Ensete ventricosum]|nr:hypothetical protein GW17_00009877 [Ensete ventricosum]RWW78502.1 hypothetical protein BHE74_00013270 [Ensete ventricosum]RZR79103.1 hypothetical protein BHM03_00004704 [Ensete ventricosum]
MGAHRMIGTGPDMAVIRQAHSDAVGLHIGSVTSSSSLVAGNVFRWRELFLHDDDELDLQIFLKLLTTELMKDKKHGACFKDQLMLINQEQRKRKKGRKTMTKKKASSHGYGSNSFVRASFSPRFCQSSTLPSSWCLISSHNFCPNHFLSKLLDKARLPPLFWTLCV